MQEDRQQKAVGSVRAWEIVVAAAASPCSARVVMWDSWRLGARWGSDGPQAGYFPFYIGLFIIVSAAFILYAALKMEAADAGAPFVRWGQLRLVLTMLIPSAVYVALIDNPWIPLGIYVRLGALHRVRSCASWASTAGSTSSPVSVGDHGGVLPHVRGLVQGAAAQGAARGGPRASAEARDARNPFPARRLRGRVVVVQPDADVRRDHPRRDHRRAAGPGRRQRRGDPAAAHLLHGAEPGRPTSAIILLSCIYWGALFGGAITSILFNIPGEPWSVATTFDGYPLAQKGRAGAALTAAFTSSFVGALVGGAADHVPVAASSRASRCASGRRSSSRCTCSPSARSSA